MPKKFKVTIDREQCIGDMVCVSLCPDVFEMGDDGKAQIIEKYRTGDNIGEGIVPEELGECVKSASEACPVQIISVVEVSE